MVEGGGASLLAKRRPPATSVSLHTSFFIPSLGSTHGPPVSDQPGEAAMANSRPRRSASPAAKRKASFHSGVM